MRPLFFLWIPKTGGATLHHTFLKIYNKRHIGGSWSQNPGLPGMTFDDCDYIVGHWPASIIPRLPNPVTVTLLRNPIGRVISHYNWQHEHGYPYDPEFTEWMRKATFREWLDSPYSRRAANNLMTRFLCDREEDNLDRAIQALYKIDIVGMLCDYQAIIDRSCDLTGYDPQKVAGKYHVSTKTISFGDLSIELKSELYERNSKDYKLLYYVKAHGGATV